MGFKLAELFVEFTTRGLPQVKTAMDQVKAGIDAITGSGAMGAVAGVYGKLAEAVGGFGSAIAGFVGVGLQGTVQGERMNYAIKRFSETVAALFMPLIETATDLLRGFTATLEQSGAMATIQDMMQDIAQAMAQIFEVLAPIAVDLLGIFADVMQSIFIPIMKVAVEVLKQLVEAFGWLVKGMAAVVHELIGTDDKAKKPLQKLQRSGGGPEGITQTYQRIQSAVLRQDSGPSHMEQIAKNTGDTAKGVSQDGPLYNILGGIRDNIQPAIGQ